MIALRILVSMSAIGSVSIKETPKTGFLPLQQWRDHRIDILLAIKVINWKRVLQRSMMICSIGIATFGRRIKRIYAAVVVHASSLQMQTTSYGAKLAQ